MNVQEKRELDDSFSPHVFFRVGFFVWLPCFCRNSVIPMGWGGGGGGGGGLICQFLRPQCPSAGDSLPMAPRFCVCYDSPFAS